MALKIDAKIMIFLGWLENLDFLQKYTIYYTSAMSDVFENRVFGLLMRSENIVQMRSHPKVAPEAHRERSKGCPKAKLGSPVRPPGSPRGLCGEVLEPILAMLNL